MPCRRLYAALRLLIAAMQLQAFVNAAQPTASTCTLVSGIASAAVPAIAQARVRGAAELDAEYYARRAFEKVTNTSPDVFDARRRARGARRRGGATRRRGAAGGRTKGRRIRAGDGERFQRSYDYRRHRRARKPGARKTFAARAAAGTGCWRRDLRRRWSCGARIVRGGGRAPRWTRRAERHLRPRSAPRSSRVAGRRLPPRASFKSLIKGAEDTLAAWKAAGWTKDAKITFEGSADLGHRGGRRLRLGLRGQGLRRARRRGLVPGRRVPRGAGHRLAPGPVLPRAGLVPGPVKGRR